MEALSVRCVGNTSYPAGLCPRYKLIAHYALPGPVSQEPRSVGARWW